MKIALKITVAALVSLSAAFGAFAQEFTKGVVNKVDAKANKVTIKHEDLKNLDMPAMTMVFRVEDPALLEKLKEGSNIEFVAERVNGKLTVTEVK
ncbi:copper-binding protein [Rhizobium leguminosarum]|uniref:Copper-binding protein n=3 Tax=Rhizobium TaxID=379 RepID=A0A179BU77_RHILE|nr:copper-binding protein [Rhizobium leguminosarum]OAP95258.1 hypothetical protein A4U53_39175 [Rhizobium leguminosarum]